MSNSRHPHIEIRENGRAYIVGTGFKVRMVIEGCLAYGWDAEEYCRQHPPMTLEQFHYALAYYYDNKVEIDREIEEGVKLAERLRAEQGESPIDRKLRELGRKLP